MFREFIIDYHDELDHCRSKELDSMSIKKLENK